MGVTNLINSILFFLAIEAKLGSFSGCKSTIIRPSIPDLEHLLITSRFNILSRWGTLANQADIEPRLKGDSLQRAYKYLKDYYDSDLLAILFAPLFPKYSRNVLWKLTV